MKTNSYAPSHKLFDWIFCLFAGLWTIGAYIDGWAHIHLEDSLETFFTVWHLPFYLGIFLTCALLAIQIFINIKKRFSLKHSLPKEYMFALFGVVIALVGGTGDMIWHNIFGVEVGVEALLSPTHLLLALGGAITVAGPLYAIWHRHKDEKIHAFPTLLSACYFIMTLGFMLQFLNPFYFPWPAESFLDQNIIETNPAIGLGIANIIIFTSLFFGTVLSMIKKWRLPVGSFTLMLTITIGALVIMHGEYLRFIGTALIAGVFIDLLYWSFSFCENKRTQIELFMIFAPIALFAMYFFTLGISDEITWSIHMWAGAIAISGLAGLLLSKLSLNHND